MNWKKWRRTDYQSQDFACDTSVLRLSLLFLVIMLFSYKLVVSTLIAIASASNVIELTPANFDSLIGKGKPALVEL